MFSCNLEEIDVGPTNEIQMQLYFPLTQKKLMLARQMKTYATMLSCNSEEINVSLPNEIHMQLCFPVT